ncbi:MAG: glutamate--tRNA ligase [Methanomicrobiales archaeon]|nr:glutamate--tRNA ligase [Methanomicrobiales archaeon]
MEEDPRGLLLVYALQNAVQHNSVPKAGTVLGTLLGKHPEYRSRIQEAKHLLAEVLAEVEGMPPAEREAMLARLAPDLLAPKAGKRPREQELPPLENAEQGVVMRFAPNPSGPLHLGHARAAYLNDYYVRRYGGRYVLRIEDTDPRRVEEENYGLLLDDIDWLDLAVTEIVYQSDRMDIYYDYCRRLIELEGAYVCTCEAELFRSLKLEKKACPCRSQNVEENLGLWDRMLSGLFHEGMVTVRVRTDLAHPDPAMRDFSIFRIVDTPPHPRCEARVYPLMNFSVVVDDHLLGITHVIRGKDHIANTRRQQYIYDYFGWKPPYYLHYGRMSIEGVVLSTSAMKEGIREHRYTGWDDPHLGTLKAIARRGILPGAVRSAIIDIGVGETDISFSWENLYAKNKALVDPDANRYFFVPQPVLCRVAGAGDQTAHALLHPNHPERGSRDLAFRGGIYVSPDDVSGHALVRLKDLFNVRIHEEKGTFRLEYAGDSLEEVRAARAPIVQWLPEETVVPCLLRKPEGDIPGLCEPAVAGEAGKVVQFERVGFVRIDSAGSEGVQAYYAHR